MYCAAPPSFPPQGAAFPRAPSYRETMTPYDHRHRCRGGRSRTWETARVQDERIHAGFAHTVLPPGSHPAVLPASVKCGPPGPVISRVAFPWPYGNYSPENPAARVVHHPRRKTLGPTVAATKMLSPVADAGCEESSLRRAQL